MNQNLPLFLKILRIAFLVVGIMFLHSVNAQNKTSNGTGNWDNVIWSPAGLPNENSTVTLENGAVTIPAGQTVTISSLVIGKDAYLQVEGTLIVKGNATMTNNSLGFNMGDNSAVIIYGNFEVNNQVTLSLQSYLIVYGQFIAKGSSNQTFLDVENANIYIFGGIDGNGWPDSFTCTGDQDYAGTPDINTECDFGSEDDYENNQDQFPPDLVDAFNCYDLSNLRTQPICEGESTTVQVNPLNNVSYEWQRKLAGEDSWVPVLNSNTFILNVTETTSSNFGDLYRVVVRPTAEANCKISISRNISLAITPIPSLELNVPATVCENDEIYINGIFSGNPPFELDYIINGENFTQSFEDKDFELLFPAQNLDFELLELRSGTCTQSLAQSYTITVQSASWTGQINSQWNNDGNWRCMPIPDNTKDVNIPGDAVNFPVIQEGESAYLRNLNIEENASILIKGQMHISGDMKIDGFMDASAGTVIFKGISVQTIPAGAFLNNRIQNLTLDNSSGLISEGQLELTGILLLENGIFSTNNSLVLISSAEKTALIDGSGMGEVSGAVTMQRYLDVAFGYKYFSTPFQNSVVGDFEPFLALTDATTGFPHVYRYEENRTLNDTAFATGWQAYDNAENILEVGQGYAFNFGANTDEILVEISGEVNNGTFSRNLENNKGEYTRGFHLIGNPYPSPIDWDASEGWEKTNIEDGIYFFTAGETQYTGIYTSYVNGVSSTDGRSSSIIPSMQGFFVKVTDPAEGVPKVTGTLAVSNKARVTDFDQQFLKIMEREEKPLLRLTAAYEAAAKKDAMVLYFSPNAGKDFNKGMDAHKLLNTDPSVPNLYTLSENKINLSIKALAFPESGSYDKIPLGITAGKSGRMQISLNELQNIPSHWNIYLVDKEKRTGQDLREKSDYSFSIKKGEYHDRFQLMFSKERISDPAIAFDDLFSVDSRGYLKVKLNLPEAQRGEVRVSTVTGQLLEIKEGRGREQVEFRSITSSGIYFINLYVNDQRHSKKILVNN